MEVNHLSSGIKGIPLLDCHPSAHAAAAAKPGATVSNISAYVDLTTQSGLLESATGPLRPDLPLPVRRKVTPPGAMTRELRLPGITCSSRRPHPHGDQLPRRKGGDEGEGERDGVGIASIPARVGITATRSKPAPVPRAPSPSTRSASPAPCSTASTSTPKSRGSSTTS